MKKNNQGFMLVEALIMSVVVIGVLVFMYIQFQNISTAYDKSFRYNTVNNLYITNEIKEYLVINEKLNDLKEKVDDSEKFVDVTETAKSWTTPEDGNTLEAWNELLTKANINKVILTDEALSELKGKRTADLSEKFNDFINYLKVDKEDNKYRLSIEFKDGTYASLKIEIGE